MFLPLSIVGFLMLAIILFLLFKGKSIPIVLFVTVPVIIAFAAGFSLRLY